MLGDENNTIVVNDEKPEDERNARKLAAKKKAWGWGWLPSYKRVALKEVDKNPPPPK